MSVRNSIRWTVVDDLGYRTAAGLSLIATGAVLILGIITAEALFPGYSTADQTISALGAARGTPASRAIFNPALGVSGFLLLGASFGLHRAYRRRSLATVVAISGIGAAGAAVFPSQTGLPHGLAAILAFVGFGLIALVAADVVAGPFAGVSALAGVLELVVLLGWTAVHPPTGSVHGLGVILTFVAVGVGALAVAAVVSGTARYVAAGMGVLALLSLVSLLVFVSPETSIPDVTSLGVGGLERWVTYLALVWLTAFGGFLLADGHPHDE